MYRQALALSDDELAPGALPGHGQLAHSEMPVIPLFHDRGRTLCEDVAGWAISPVNRLDLRRVNKSMTFMYLEAAETTCHAQNRQPHAHFAPGHAQVVGEIRLRGLSIWRCPALVR